MGWHAQMEGKKLQSTMDIFRTVPQCCSSVTNVHTVIQFIDTCVLCCGHNDERFVSYIMSKNAKIMDHTETKCVAFFDEKHYTIRCSDCELLVHIDSHATYDMPHCSRCRQYHNNLRALVSRSEKQGRVTAQIQAVTHHLDT